MKYSGFTFIHNGIEGGYPFVEAINSVKPFVDEMIVVDMGSTDGTREVLDKMGVTIIDMAWRHISGKILDEAFELHTQCQHENIIFFEADEVFDRSLLENALFKSMKLSFDFTCYRLQLEQNFQRCRWYPEPVHRFFKRGLFHKKGHTTTGHDKAYPLSMNLGMLWDITYCFRDNWIKRLENNAEYRNEEIIYRRTPLHFCEHHEIDMNEVNNFLNEPQWTWKTTPFNIPPILRNLVGETTYQCLL